MRSYLIGAAMVATTTLIVWAGHARAEPPPSGMMVSFRHPMVVCEEQSQIKEIVAAHVAGDEAKTKTLMERPECQLALARNVVVRESEDVGIVAFGETSEHLWIVQIDTGNKKFAALYEELAETKHETSI